GHNPPRVKSCTNGTISSLDGAQSLPLGIMAETEYQEAEITFLPGDQVIFYTDGITEAMNPVHEQFGVERLDKALENCMLTAEGLIDTVVAGVEDFTAGHAPDDDRTMLVAKIR
ncbi:MAG: serine/threonine-protein phosphatase, partial [Phycisphaerales bacterium]|nr:serine/threonine-protein phosphatase [Phycisphaerales bacterium]